MRVGVLARKLGMTQIYNEAGAHLAVTVLSIDDAIVTGLRNLEKDGYEAVQIGIKKMKAKHGTKPLLKAFEKNGVDPRRVLKEFKGDNVAEFALGNPINADYFKEGQFVDVTGVSVGKGFQGVMRRYNFGGGRATHGNSVSHRAHGSTGQNQDPGRVFKGKKMAGHMGARQITTQNLTIAAVDGERNLLFVHGSVPGHKDSYIMIKDAVKKQGK